MTFRTSTEILNSAKELYEAQKYQEVIDLREEIDIDSVSPEDRAHLFLLYVDAGYYAHGIVKEAELNEVLRFYRNSQDDDKYAWAKYLYGCLLMIKGEHFDAREVLLESYILLKRHDSKPRQQARILNRLGQLCFHLGDFDGSELYIKKCIGIYGDLQDHANRIFVSGNLAVIYCYGGFLIKAIEVYSQIVTQISGSLPKNISNAYMQYAISLYLKGDTAAAHEWLEKARPLVEGSASGVALYWELLGVCYEMEESFLEAKSALLNALKTADEIAPEGVLVSQIKRHLGCVSLELQDLKKARSYNDEALDIALKINEKIVIAGCYHNRGRLAVLGGHSDEGREWFQKAIDIYKSAHSRYDLALTRYTAAMSGAFQGGEKQALLYLAREYFAGEDVKKYVDKINVELSSLPVPILPAAGRGLRRTSKIIAANEDMRRLISMAEHVASSEMSVLLTGATGTGKDLFARYIHECSGRPGRFVSINAAAIPDSMVESELFGHCRGAFTNADRDKVGLIEVAHNGTLYLNEIADSSKELQAKLLDVLENRRIRRLGETKERDVAFRLIAATNHDLNHLISDGRFRIDLYHRLGEVPFALPLLRDRLDDIGALTAHFLTLAGVAVDEDCPDFKRLVLLLSRRDWPGNVRQLEAEVKRLALLSGSQVSQMPKFLLSGKPSERDALVELLQQSGWNRREVARKLGVSDTTIRRKIRKFKLGD